MTGQATAGAGGLLGAMTGLRRLLGGQPSGPAVAGLFHRLLALVLLDAWLSLGSQVRLLIGARGLLPLADFV